MYEKSLVLHHAVHSLFVIGMTQFIFLTRSSTDQQMAVLQMADYRLWACMCCNLSESKNKFIYISFVILPICMITALAVLCYSFLLALPFVMEYFMLGTQVSIKTLVKKNKKSAFTTLRQKGCQDVCNLPVLVLDIDLLVVSCNQDVSANAFIPSPVREWSISTRPDQWPSVITLVLNLLKAGELYE